MIGGSAQLVYGALRRYANGMYSPSLQAFSAAAAPRTLHAVYRELVADTETPVAAFARVAHEPYAFLLESVTGGETWGAYSFVGHKPRGVVQWQAGTATVTWHDGRPAEMFAADDPVAALATVLDRETAIATPGLPRFWGGAVGWMGYDAVHAFENVRGPAAAHEHAHDGPPPMCMVLTDTLIIFDNVKQTLKVVAIAHVRDGDAPAEVYAAACARIAGLVALLRAAPPALPALPPPRAGVRATTQDGLPHDLAPPSTFPRHAFVQAVDRIREYIAAGDAFQVVLSQRFVQPRAGLDAFTTYRVLRLLNPSPYMYHLNFPEATVTGASPETLVRLVDGDIALRPIAGTRHRGCTPAEDAALATELRNDRKERAEHLMLIDLGRNDVGRVAAVGTVAVRDMMAIERYSHVMHMTSEVTGRVADGLGWPAVLRAAFPAGTLSGAPKIRAMQIIDELEPHPRAIYGGAIGYISYTGNMDVAIAIRTMVGIGDELWVQAGAGVVADSQPEAEYEETVNKARAVLRAIELARAVERDVQGVG